MKRIAVVGALVLLMALAAGPALAQSVLPEGSVLPEQQERETLPTGSRGGQSVASAARSGATQPALADTGIELSTGAFLAGGLIVLGGGALAVSRRRAGQR